MFDNKIDCVRCGGTGNEAAKPGLIRLCTMCEGKQTLTLDVALQKIIVGYEVDGRNPETLIQELTKILGSIGKVYYRNSTKAHVRIWLTEDGMVEWDIDDSKPTEIIAMGAVLQEIGLKLLGPILDMEMNP